MPACLAGGSKHGRTIPLPDSVGRISYPDADHATVTALVRADLRDLIQDLKLHWARFGTKNNRTALEDQLAEAILQTTIDPKVKALASGWAEQRKFEKQIELIIQAGDTATIRELQKLLGDET